MLRELQQNLETFMRWLVVSLLAELQVAFITDSLMAIPNDLCDFIG